MTTLTLLYGGLVGLCLGLTGGGGATIAIPLLVYGMGISPRDAVGISLAVVGTTAFIGFLMRWYLGEVAVRIGLLFALTSMMATPLGTLIGQKIPEVYLLLAFAGLVIFVAMRLWRKSKPTSPSTPVDQTTSHASKHAATTSHTIPLNKIEIILLLVTGVVTGLLSGLFGVGGGFIIVPALVLIWRMPMRLAIGTSLLVISCISVVGVVSNIWVGRNMDPMVLAGFSLGGAFGMIIGIWISRFLSGPALQKLFAVALLAIAGYIIIRHAEHLL